MHDNMQYDPIHGQGHKPFTVGNEAIFKNYLFRDCNGSGQLTKDS